MAAHNETIEHWSGPQDSRMRLIKSQMEEELLIKLGAKRELVDIHPLILSTRPERSKSFVTLNYSRAIPPAKQAPNQNHSPWIVDDPALRQMSNFSRRGPRDFILPNLVKPVCPARSLVIPSIDEEYYARRQEATFRLSQLLGEWAVYENLAYHQPLSRAPTLSEVVGLNRKLSHGSIAHVTQGQVRPLSSDSFASSGSGGSASKGRPLRPVPRSRKTKNRWQEMAGEALLHIKACRMRLPGELPRSELRIYVSSTPDLREEREFLEEVAYPKLREFCEKLGLNCHVVDMRNGAGVLDNSLNTFDLIEKELRTCRTLSIGPYFVSLLGHKISEPGLPGFFPKTVYEMIREILVRENIIGVEAFDDVYRLDSNRIPPVYIKQSIRALEEYQTPEQVEKILLSALKQAVKIIRKSSSKEENCGVDFYKWSALVKEHEEGLLTSYSPRSDSVCFMMDSQEAEKDPGHEAKPILRLRHAVFRHFRHCASTSNLVSFKSGRKTLAYLRSISDTFIAGVASLLRAQIRHRDYNLTQQLTEGSEALQHVRIALAAAQESLDNSDTVARVKSELEKNDPKQQAIVLIGPAGTGKTTIVSQVARASVLWEPRRKVVFRCLGMTLRSASLYRVLESLINQLGFIYNCHIDLPEDALAQQIVSTFCQILQSVSANRHLAGDLLLILDQLERLPDLEARFLISILNCLPEGVTVLFTCETPTNIANVLTSHNSVTRVHRTFINKREVSKYISGSLTAVNRLVTEDQQETALKALPSEATPVYAQILYHITRWWPSTDLPEIPAFSGDPDIDFSALLESLETGLGTAFSRYALSLLATARYGLADHEILHLLSKDADLLNEIEGEKNERISLVEGFPYQLQLSYLIERLDRFLTNIKIEGESVYQICSQPLKKAITTRYLSSSFFYTTHNRLANFFLFIRRGLLLSSRDISERKHRQLSKYHWRTLRCVPYHLCHSSPDTAFVWEQLKEKVFFNFTWLVNAVYSGFLPDLLDDLAYALEHVSLDPDIQYLQQLLLQVRRTVVHNPMSMAAVFSSQNPEDRERTVRDSVRALIHEARQWLTQVHLQALVPVTYTTDKSGRLLVKENSLFGVTGVQIIPDNETSEGRLLVQRGCALTVLNMLTREEIPLVTLQTEVLAVKVVNDSVAMVIATGVSTKACVEVLDLKKGKKLKSVPIHEPNFLWFDIRSENAVYFATEKGIKCLDVGRVSVVNVLSPSKPWDMSLISPSKPEKIITMTTEEKIEIKQMRAKNVTSAYSVKLDKEPINKHCAPLVATKDGRFIIHITERQAQVIEITQFRVTSTFSHHNLPIVHSALSRSHEHIFLGFASGAVTAHVLLSGLEVFSAKTQPSPRPQIQMSTGRGKRGINTGSDAQQVELITAMVTSEDDHFLLLGTNLGQVYIFHLPSGHQLVDISTGQGFITNLLFLTDKSHFQHLISLDSTGKALHWNFRPLFAQARRLVQPYIADEDMYKEEEPKVDLNTYFTIFQGHSDDRIFLNGPDVAAFYKPLPGGVFAELCDLDPAFGEQFDWEVKGTIADLNDHLLALVCGHELNDTILTVSSDLRLGRWSLKDGGLVWCRRLPGSDGSLDGNREAVVHDLALVYWDQAILLVQNSRTGEGYGLSVIYTGEGQKKLLSRDNVEFYWVSTDRSQVMLQCRSSQEPQGFQLYKWDLVRAKEEQCETVHISEEITERGNSRCTFTIFSPTLQQSASVFLPSSRHGVKTPPSANAHKYSLPSSRQDDKFHQEEESGMLNGNTSSIEKDGKDDFSYSPDNDDLTSHQRSYSSIPKEGGSAAAETAQNTDKIEVKQQELHEESVKEKNTGESASLTRLYGNTQTRLTWSNIKTRVIAEPELTMKKLRIASGGMSRLSPGTRRNSSRRDSYQSRGETPTGKIDPYEMASKLDPGPDGLRSSSTSGQGGLLAAQTVPHLRADNNHKEPEADTETNKVPAAYGIYSLPVAVTAGCFIGEESLTLGTDTGHVIGLPLPDLEPLCVLGESGPKIIDRISLNLLLDLAAPHEGTIMYMTISENASMLVTADKSVVCLWNVAQRMLIMKVCLEKNQEISQLVISKDASIVAVATTDRVMRLWTPLERREVASYMTTFDIVDLQMTSDCHKIIVRGVGKESKPVLEVFEVRNVDDILMQVPSRKVSREQERRESLVQERVYKRSDARRKSDSRRYSVDN
ncbi:NACHT domain- and WD repeat-containing protein 1-like [Plakobranchus ocellatus]|uniref:NACHT domain- and WD repeat-containing protein 1-like n=1 Tax=Plakobranchus ocellatus TaxID=259542 RepID=A0AAV4D2F5_9GAST|nr:NACHT domain- and WD repeat-containing protein 1-like [Plakobranchus ocellatus]